MKLINNMYVKQIAAVTLGVVYMPLSRKWFISQGMEDGAGFFAAVATLCITASFGWVIITWQAQRGDK